MYVVFCDNPVSEYVVDTEAVLTTIVDQTPVLFDLSISYPVMAEPPLFTGDVQWRLIFEDETAVAVRPVGGCGMVCVVADAVFDGELVPTELIAETR